MSFSCQHDICSKTIYKQIRFKQLQTLSFETKRMNKLSKYCNANKEEYILLLQLMGRQRADLHDPSCHQVYCILLFAAAAVKYTVYHLPSILLPTKCSVTQRVYCLPLH